jgi:hypothetical protein
LVFHVDGKDWQEGSAGNPLQEDNERKGANEFVAGDDLDLCFAFPSHLNTLTSSVHFGHNERVERVAIFGASGAGKTTLAGSLAELAHLRHLEVDGIFHQANWTPLDDETFLSRVDELTKASGWVTDGNYSTVRPLIVERADTILWLDYDRMVTTRRVILRTMKRALTRQVLWNGNREAVSNLIRFNPEYSVIRWSWTSHGPMRETFGALLASGEISHATVLRFRHPRETAAWLQGLRASPF